MGDCALVGRWVGVREGAWMFGLEYGCVLDCLDRLVCSDTSRQWSCTVK
jgi:hypothetical protein